MEDSPKNAEGFPATVEFEIGDEVLVKLEQKFNVKINANFQKAMSLLLETTP